MNNKLVKDDILIWDKESSDKTSSFTQEEILEAIDWIKEIARLNAIEEKERERDYDRRLSSML